MMVLDARVLIAHFDGADAHHARATELLVELVEQPLIASPISVAEVLVGPARVGQLDRARAALKQLGVQTVHLGHEAPAALALLRAGTGLKLPDCCVLQVAEEANAGIATFDDRLAATARGRGVHVRGR